MADDITSYLHLITLQIFNVSYQCPLSPINNYSSSCGVLNALFTPYDFIIIGAGSAGCVLANRLSKNAKVLVLEAGPPPSNYSAIPINNQHLRFRENFQNWYFFTEPGNYCQGYPEGCVIHQGRGMGGSSIISTQLQYEGFKDDFNAWGSPLWTWDKVSPHLTKIKNLYNASGAGGYMEVTTPASSHQTNNLSVLAANRLGINRVTQPGNRQGYQNIPVFVKNNISMNIARGYIAPIISRSNLCILYNITVSKINIHPTTKNATGVEFKTSANLTFNATATKEVILSAGTINSPKLLMLSGIGPTNDLQENNISVKVASEQVGKNFHDQLEFPVHIMMPKSLNINQDLKTSVGNFCAVGVGPLGNLEHTNHVGYIKSGLTNISGTDLAITKRLFKQNDTILIYFMLNSSKYDVIAEFLIKMYNLNSSLMILHPTLLKPQSRGYIKLRSTNIYDPPRIYPNFLNENTSDLAKIKAGLKHVIDLLGTEEYKGFNLSLVTSANCLSKFNNTDELWTCTIKALSRPLGNAGGTCKMGPNIAVSVVNEKLRVHGVPNLRVVDSSITPAITSGDLVTRNILIGETAAEFIISDWGLPLSSSSEVTITLAT